jgi:hypothetical protein
MPTNPLEGRTHNAVEESDRVTASYRMTIEQAGLTRGKFAQLRDKISQDSPFTDEEKSMLISAVDIQTRSRLDSQINDVIRELKHWDPTTTKGYAKNNMLRLSDIVLNELMW